MRKELRFIFILFLLSILSSDVHATRRFWVGATSTSWKTTANWSATSGGTGGASIPGSNDTAIFNGSATSHHRCNLDSLVNVKRLAISGDTLSQGANTITLGSSGGNFTGGVFLGGSSSITVSGLLTIAGNAFTSTSGTLSSSANFTFSSGSFAHNSGKVKFTATNTITGSITFYQLEFNPGGTAATYTIASGTTLTVSNTLSIQGTAGVSLNTGTIDAKGDITITNSGTTGLGTGTIRINGTVNQTFTGSGTTGQGRVPNVVINKTSDTLKLISIISVFGNWTYTAGIINVGTSTINFSNTSTISGSHSLYNVNFSGASARTFTIASGTTLTIKGTMVINNGFDVTLNTGTINAEGDITITNTATGGGGTANVNICGTGNQTLTGTTTDGQGLLPNITINKSSGTLTLSNSISVKGDWTHTNGTISPGSSTLYFITTKTITITGSHPLKNVTFDGSASSTYTIASGTTLTVGGTLTTNGSNSITLSTGTINAAGKINLLNSSSSGGGSATIVINGGGDQDFIGNGTSNTGPLCNVTIAKTSGNLFLSSVITCAGDWIYNSGQVYGSYYSGGTFVTSTVAFTGTKNLDGYSTSNKTMPFYDVTIYSGTRTLTGNLEADNNLTINSSATLSAGSNAVTVGGNWSDNGTWTYGTSSVTFNGGTINTISKSSGTETFYDMGFNRTGKYEKLNNPVTVNHVLTLTQGHIITDTVNYLLLILNATLSGGGDNAYVHGPVRKTGNNAFTFPLGDTTLADDAAYHPLAMTAPSSTSDQFQAQYLAKAQTYGDSLVDSLVGITQDEYWTVERKAGSSNITASISWNRNATDISNYDDLRVANWNGTKWLDLGVSTVTITGANSGTITASFPINFTVTISPISRARRQASVPYLTLQRKLDGDFYYVTNGRLLFKYDEEYNDADRKLTFNIYGDHNQLLTSDALIPTSMLPLIYTVYGDNRYQLNLADCAISPNGYLPNGYYVLEVINEKSEKRYLRFKNTSFLQYVICSPNPN